MARVWRPLESDMGFSEIVVPQELDRKTAQVNQRGYHRL